MKNLIPFFTILIVFVSCKKESADEPAPPSAPVATSLSPASGQPETLITISGTNFSTIANENVVKFNGVVAAVTSASATSLIAKVPVSAGSGLVTVTTPHGTTSGISFSYIPDLYIGGIETNGTNGVGKYWKNGTSVSVTDGTKITYAYSMALSGSDVYLAGSEQNASGISVAKYWKNGVATSLSDGNRVAGVYSIVIIGNDIYAAGWESNGTNDVAKYWKNGVPNALTDGTRMAIARSIFVSGNDVYVAGEEAAPNGSSEAKYWKNGVSTTLSNNTNINASAMQIAVLNNDIHIAIYAFDGTNITYQYWKNGTFTPISGATQIDQLLVAGNDVYMAGRQSLSATYWKNGVPVLLTDGSKPAFAHSIALYGNDVYVVGNEYNGSVKIGKYWKNGVPTIFTNGSYDASPWSIIVR